MNGIYAITTEGQKVAKDEVVFRYYKESEKETTENIKKIDYEIQEELEKDKTSRAIPVEIGNIIPHLFNRKVSKENIFFRNKPCKAFPLNQGEF